MNEADNEITDFTYEIPDCLMDGDYIELLATCLGDNIAFELLTKEYPVSLDAPILPLRINLSTGGPVTVISRNRNGTSKQDRFVKNGIQEDMTFKLCVYAHEDRYEIFLNEEKVCVQNHRVPLNQVYSLSMQGKVDIHMLEFKDLYYEDEANSPKPQGSQAGFVRVNELRQSSIRKNDPPQMIPTRMSSRKGKAEVSTWKTANDLSKPDLDIDYKIDPPNINVDSPKLINKTESKPQLTSPLSFAKENDRKSQEIRNSQYSVVDNQINTDAKYKMTLPGNRKSVTLSQDKLEHQMNFGDKPNLQVGGDMHRGSYHVLDDQEPVMRRLTSTISTPNLQDKPKKKRFSLLGKNRKSKGSESDVRISGDLGKKKSKGSVPDLKIKDNDGEKKRKSLHLKNPFKRHKNKGETPTNSFSGISGSNSRLSSTLTTPIVTHGNENRMSKDMAKKPAPELASYLQKSNPTTDFDMVSLTGERAMVDDVHFKSNSMTPLHGNVHENMNNHAQTLDNSKILSTDVSKKGKGEAPHLASVLYDQNNPTLNSHNFKSPLSSPKIPEQSGKSKFTASEMASSLFDQKNFNNYKDVTLTNMSHKEPNLPGKSPLAYEISVDANNSSVAKIKDTSPAFSSVNGNLAHNASTPNTPISVFTVSGQDKISKSSNSPAIKIDTQVHPGVASDSLTGTQGFKSGLYEKPRLDIDYVPHKSLEKHVFTPPSQKDRKAVSVSGYHSGGEHSDSGESAVNTDQEFYLEVGKSDYYFARKQSLKNYRSKRSKKQDRAIREKMGISRNDSEESAVSSISSLKPTDRVMTAQTTKKRSGAGREEVNSWLNSHDSGYTQPYYNEQKVVPSYHSRVHAQPPSNRNDNVNHYLFKDIDQVLKGEQAMDLPLALNPGRNATLYGHFNVNLLENQYCFIKLVFKSEKELQNIYLKVWSNGGLDILKHCDNKSENVIIETSHNNNNNWTYKYISYFVLTFLAQSFYLAITSNDLWSLILPKSKVQGYLSSIELMPTENVNLDRFVMQRNMILPLVLYVTELDAKSHNLNLATKFTAFSKSLSVQLNIKDDVVQNTIFIELNFDQSVILLKKNERLALNENKIVELPFIPEQIRDININLRNISCNNNNELLIQLNDTILMEHEFEFITKNLRQIVINGDLTLLDAKLESV